jgi:hypothetical protein
MCLREFFRKKIRKEDHPEETEQGDQAKRNANKDRNVIVHFDIPVI